MKIELLLLDAGKVLVDTGITEKIKQQLNLKYYSGHTLSERFYDFWDEYIRDPLWSGEISIEKMWDILASEFYIEERIYNFPIKELPWTKKVLNLPVQKAILSNHRHEWLMPAIESFNWPNNISIYISSLISLVKPEKEAYELVINDLKIKPENILFVDDKDENIAAAGELRMYTIKADEKGYWTNYLMETING